MGNCSFLVVWPANLNLCKYQSRTFATRLVIRRNFVDVEGTKEVKRMINLYIP